MDESHTSALLPPFALVPMETSSTSQNGHDGVASRHKRAIIILPSATSLSGQWNMEQVESKGTVEVQ